jgi:hypothetical protein
MDAADHLWVAVWGGGEVRRYAPDKTLVDRVATGAPHTSGVAFAGEELHTLVIVPGLPVAPWQGRPAGPLRPPHDGANVFMLASRGCPPASAAPDRR